MGFGSALAHVASRGLVSYGKGAQEGQDREMAALARALKAKREDEDRKLQTEKTNAEIAKLRAPAAPQKWEPSNQEEATQFWKDTHPQKEVGPVPGSEAWYKMQERSAQIRARHRPIRPSSNRGNDGMATNRALSTLNQQIDDNRSSISAVNSQQKSIASNYDGAPTTRPKTNDPNLINTFVSDSTDYANIPSRRRALMARGDSLQSSRDQIARKQRMDLGFGEAATTGSPTTITAGAGTDDTPKGVDPEAAALYAEAAEAYKREGDINKYNRAVAAISRHFGLVKK